MSHSLMIHLKRMLCAIVAVLLMVGATPAVAFADTTGDPAASSSSNTCSPVTPAATGIQHPTGSAASTFTYNACTGLWENQYYTWSPATQTTSPKNAPVYTCDQTTWTWLTYTWTFNAATQSYTQVPTHVTTVPVGGVVDPNSLNPCAPLPPQQTTTNGPNGGSSNTSADGNSTTVGMQNDLFGSVGTGGASVIGNTTAGDATSGAASAMATVINAVQSSSSLTDGTVTTFTANINGDVQGDLVIDPSQLQPATSDSALANNELSVNNDTNGQINNNIELDAASGSATVANNTTAGSATTGSATAIANVINFLNSLVSAGKSFVGVININGSLHGNILLPQQLLDSLIASNAPSTTVTLNNTEANSLGITNTNNLSTTNNVTSSATSGTASVTNNTIAGNAKTGAASTQVRVFNLTGSQIVGSNCLLVFVNVSGKWIGVIFNAPAGATAAAFGSGITSDTTTNTASVTNTTNDAITNTIDVNAASGNALVDSNTTAGGATSGDASTAVNLLNVNNSELNLSGWFGILFINIFGDWYGNLAAYNPAAPQAGMGAGHHTTNAAGRPVFQYIPKTETSSTATGPSLSNLANKLAHSAGKALSHLEQTQKTKAATGLSSQAIGGIVVACGLALFAVERLVSARQARMSRP